METKAMLAVSCWGEGTERLKLQLYNELSILL